MKDRLSEILVGHLEVHSEGIHLETSQNCLQLVLVKKGQVFESDSDVVKFVGHKRVDDAGKDVLLLQHYLLFFPCLLSPTTDVCLDLFN